jgi:hypothetical protein
MLDRLSKPFILTLAMKTDGKKICKAGSCGKRFRPVVPAQDYCSKRCKNRAAQARLRARAKLGEQYLRSMGK